MQFSKPPTQTLKKKHIKQTWRSLTETQGFEKWHKNRLFVGQIKYPSN